MIYTILLLVSTSLLIRNPIYIKVTNLTNKSAFVIFPFIFLNKRVFPQPLIDLKALIEHEKVHFLQQKETFVIGAFVFSWIEIIYKRIFCYSTWSESRMNLSMEREAYLNQRKEEYFKNRPIFNWLNYLHDAEKD